jgi:enamine deaminase RidA (YjgF/YER057c/UK114 family)
VSMEIKRWRKGTVGRSHTVAYAGIVWTVANARNVNGDLDQQIDETLSLLEASLREAGSSKEQLLSVQVMLLNINDRSSFDRKWCEWIGPDSQHWPQRAVLGASLAPGLLLEVTATAAA